MLYCNKCGDQIEENEKYCNKCGNPLFNDNFIYNKFVKDNKKNELKKIRLGVIITIVLLFIVASIIFFSNYNTYYFNTDDSDDNNEIIYTKKSTSREGKYNTIIIYDNIYTGINIKNKSDAQNLIVKDSVSQKNKCPSKIKKVEDKIINKYGITAVNLCEMDTEFALELGNVFEKIYKDYPNARGYLTNLTLVNGTMSENYIAAFMPIFNFASSSTDSTYPWVIKTQVLLNTTYFLNKERLELSVSDGSNLGHFPKNSTIYSPVAHELGHYLSFLAMMKNYNIDSILLIDNNNIDGFYNLSADFSKGEFSLSMIKEAYGRFKMDTNSNIKFDEWRGTISKYALAKNNDGEFIYDETIAESFHDVYLNGANASVASKYVVQVLNEKLGG